MTKAEAYWILDELRKECLSEPYGEAFGIAQECIEFADLMSERTPPISNADRIRAMSDEELAKWMAGLTTVGACNDLGIPQREDEECGGQCGVCCLEWLKQPAEEDT